MVVVQNWNENEDYKKQKEKTGGGELDYTREISFGGWISGRNTKSWRRAIPYSSGVDGKLWNMDEFEIKEVKISEQFDRDIIALFIYGEEVFGTIAAKNL